MCLCVLCMCWIRGTYVVSPCSLFRALTYSLKKTSLALIYPLPLFSPTIFHLSLLIALDQVQRFFLFVSFDVSIVFFCLFCFADNRLRSRSPKKENNYHSTRSFSVYPYSFSLLFSFCSLLLSLSRIQTRRLLFRSLRRHLTAAFASLKLQLSGDVSAIEWSARGAIKQCFCLMFKCVKRSLGKTHTH